MSASFASPQPETTLPLPEHLLRVAQKNADKEVILILRALTSEYEATLASITWSQFLGDTHRQATALIRATGLSPRKLGNSTLVVGLLAQNDYRYLVSLTAMILLRWTILLISPRNSPDAVRHLMLSAGSHYLLTDDMQEHIVGSPSDNTYATICIPVGYLSVEATMDYLAEWIASLHDSEATLHDFHVEAQNACLIMHTSGSTGHPKPISWTHQFILSLTIATSRDRETRRGETIYTPLPICHGGGVGICFPNILGTESSFTFIDSRRPVSAESVLCYIKILKDRNVDAFLPPSILEDIVDSDRQDALEILRYPNAVIWGGAPLRQDVGDYLSSSGIHLVAWGGITEAGAFAKSIWSPDSDPADWAYFRLVDCFDFVFKPLDETDLSLGYKLTLSPGYVTPPVINSEDPLGFMTADLWQQHPNPKKSDQWRILGRMDDVTVLSNGEKTDNKQLESLLYSSGLISCAVTFGSGRFLNGALLLPKQQPSPYTEETEAAFIDKIWPHIINTVNRIVPRHSRLIRPLVIMAKPEKPFLFSDKQTVKRQAILSLYDEEINTAYKHIQTGANGATEHASLPPDPFDEESSIEFVRSLVADILGHDIGEDEDFFGAGLDSLQATRLRFDINTGLKKVGHLSSLPSNVIYTNPTADSLARCIRVCTGISDDHATAVTHKTTQSSIERMITQYSSHFPDHRAESPSRSEAGEVYAITGTTGSLGATFVSSLLRKQDVRKIYLLNRADALETMAQRHNTSFEERCFDYTELDTALSTGRAVYLEVVFSDEKLGLDEATYNQLTDDLTHIVHIAWRLSFGLVLSSFENHVAGLRHIIDLALSTRRPSPPHVTFVSSIAVVGRWPYAHAARETPLVTEDFTLPHGYAHAKYVCEKILALAVAQRPGLHASIVRSGQISGALSNGAWSRNEYIPTILRLSVRLGVVPNDLQEMRWLPVDVAAEVLYTLSRHGASVAVKIPLTFFNMENVVSFPWSSVANVLALSVKEATMRQVSKSEWLEYARRHDSDTPSVLMEFIDEYVCHSPLPVLDTTNSVLATGNLLRFEFTEDIIARYVNYACQ